MLKSYGIVLAAFLLFVSCAKDQDTLLERPSTVTFTSALASSGTRTTSLTSTPLPTGTHFGVLGFYQEGVAGDPGTPGSWSQLASRHWTPGFMYNVEVSHNGSAWTYSPSKQWPSDEINSVTFLAYAPYESTPDFLESGTNNAYGIASVGLPDIRFTVTDGSEDLLLSELEEDMVKTDGTVQFLFHHTLSHIRFFAKKVDPASDFTVTLTSVRLDGLKMTAVHRSGGWSDYGGTSGSITLVSSGQTVGTDYPIAPYASVLPLPQSFAGSGATLHIAYTIQSGNMLTPRTAIHDIALEDVFTGDWDEENQYDLKVIITPDDPIEFTVTWSDWGSSYNYHISQ